MPVADTMLSDLKSLPKLQIGNFSLELEVGDLPPTLEDVAKDELRESKDVQTEAIDRLREMLKDLPDLKTPYHSNTWLIRFLRPCKYYPESALKLIQRYYQFKLDNHQYYNNLIPSKEKNVFDHDILTVLPKRDQHGRRVLVIELGKRWKYNKCTLDEIFKGCVLYLEAALLEPATQVAGAVVIFDMDGLSLPQTWQFTPSFAKRIVHLIQDCIPCRLKGLHVINEPSLFKVVFALFKPFLNEKLKKRIVFHGTDRKSLHQYLSPDCLPQQYGGNLEIPRITGPDWWNLLCICEEEYKVINSYGYKK
ncbi:alpha-tocopherol transfer protein-like isoform X2 [Onthophagus taurus]|uniref:alpha-tocopherol transfer protein-like isoform X2 n=1 Tax=Onthophagus taurus TaxID=166361 RepID=UPI000C20FA0B|nr:alpha-tocopherol transfer protein-like isoform X2 [Onthophagus taurus]